MIVWSLPLGMFGCSHDTNGALKRVGAEGVFGTDSASAGAGILLNRSYRQAGRLSHHPARQCVYPLADMGRSSPSEIELPRSHSF